MTKRKEKPQAPVASYADRFVAVLWGFVQSSVESASRSLSAMQILAEMHKALPADKFIGEVHALFGNGHVKTRERTVGSVIAAIDTKVKEETAKGHTVAIPPGLRAFASKVRKVAENMQMDSMDKAMLRGTEAAYLYAVGATDKDGKKIVPTTTATTATAATATPPVNRDAIVLEAITADPDHVLAMLESYYIAKADPITISIVHETRAKIKARA